MADSWDDLDKKYAGAGGAVAADSGDPWDALDTKFAKPVAGEPAASGAPAQSMLSRTDRFVKGAPAPDAMDRARAVATGINHGFYADLFGLPVDAAANVLDLGKAGIGYVTSKITGKAPADWTMPYDRATVPGTAEWIASQVRKGSNAIGLPSPMDNPNPQENVSRILHSGGRAAGASIIPNPRATISGAQTAGNMAMGSAAGLVGGTVGEIAPDYAPVASMLPQAGRNAVSSGAKMLVRGGEQGRKNMAQRIQDLQNGGVANPSMGLASDNRLIMGVENLSRKASPRKPAAWPQRH
jgi:hypothetical protein